VDGPTITFGPMASTMMACPDDSQAQQFAIDLSNVNSHVFQDGHLFLALKFDSGIMEFAPTEAGAEATPEATEEPSEEAGLVGPVWQWVQSVYEGDMIVASTDPTRYTITFLEDGTFQAQLDCNTGFGSYTLDGSNLTIGPIGSTRMACPDDSLDSTFIEDLEAVASYAMADGNLHLTLSTDGVMELSPAP
jgi:heat shock protein HslJ